jgi:hypothetical protein
MPVFLKDTNLTGKKYFLHSKKARWKEIEKHARGPEIGKKKKVIK